MSGLRGDEIEEKHDELGKKKKIIKRREGAWGGTNSRLTFLMLLKNLFW